MHELAEQLLSHLKAAWRYRWFAVAIAWLIALFGWINVYRMPDRFEASARVSVDNASVIKNFMYGITAQPDVVQMVGSIARTLTSRPNLEKVIRMADMEVGLKSPEHREQLITSMTRNLTIQSAGGELYTIAYAHADPQKAKRVVESLLMIFVEGSRSEQKTDSEAARHFIDSELEASKVKMNAAENALVEFKRRQVLMSGGKDYTRVIEAQAALSQAVLELKMAETSREAIKKNLTDETEIPSLLEDESANEYVPPETNARIQALELKLDDLRLNYTEQHPDVIAMVRTIAQLKQEKSTEDAPRKPAPRIARAPDTQYRPMALSLATADANVAALEARVEEYRKRYEELKGAAVAAPEIDAKFGQLTRDYELAKGGYGALLARRETARITNEMEKKTNVTDFRVIDPPRVSSIPSGPNRRLLNSLVLLVALGGGAGLAFVLSQIRPTFNDERRLREVSGVQVLGTVVMAWTAAQKARRTRGWAALLISFVSLLSAYAAIMLGLVLTVSRA
ncbi:MAG TPA: XrtA system polysaccharide chain length determinant [Burkholderiales bacterium]|nr:XrtA system polysaccharide chain length determinant [Burkholderiales bacterium]